MSLPFKIKRVKLGGVYIDVHELMTKEYPDVGEAATELPAHIEYVSAELQSMVLSKLNLKQQIKSKSAQLYFKFRNPENWTAEGYAGKPTDKGVEQAIELDAERAKIIEQFNSTSGWVIRLSNLLQSLQLKLDLVRTTEATKRKLVLDSDDTERDED